MSTFNAKAQGGTIVLTKKNDTVNLGKGKDIVRAGTNDGNNNVINNYDSKNDILEIAKGITYYNGLLGHSMVGNDLIVRLGKTNIRLKNMVGKAIKFKYQGKSAVTTQNFYTELPKGISYAKSGKTTDWTKVVAGSSFSGTFKMDEYNENLKIFDGRNVAKNITIKGNDGNNVIYAGKNGGVIQAKNGNDTLYLGKGADVVRVDTADGNDVVYNYDSSKDIFEITKGTKIVDGVRGYSFVGNDLVLRLGSTKMTVKNMVNKGVRFRVEGSGKVETANFYKEQPKNTSFAKKGKTTDWTTVVANKNFSGKYDMSDFNENLKTFDGRATSKKIEIKGRSKTNNTVYIGKGGSDKIYTRSGNDTIYCGSGKDVLWFGKGDGKDTIVNSGKNDVAYLYGIKDIKQVTAKLTKGVMTLGIKGTSDTFNISGWKAGSSLSTVQLANGAKYSFAANGKFTKK